MAPEKKVFQRANRARAYRPKGSKSGLNAWAPSEPISTSDAGVNVTPPPTSFEALLNFPGATQEELGDRLSVQSTRTPVLDQGADSERTPLTPAGPKGSEVKVPQMHINGIESSIDSIDSLGASGRNGNSRAERDADALSISRDGLRCSPVNIDEGTVSSGRATWGWRGRFNRLLHANFSATEAEVQWRLSQQIVRSAGWNRTVHIAVVGGEGGAGRTTTTLGLAMAMGQTRHGSVIAIDGTIGGQRLAQIAEGNSRGLEALCGSGGPSTTAEMMDLVSRQSSACEVLGWNDLPQQPFSPADVALTKNAVDRFYSVALWDTGADMWSPTWRAVMAGMDAIAVVHTASVRGAAEAQKTVSHLSAHAPELLERCTFVGIGGAFPLEPTCPTHTIDTDAALINAPLIWDDLPRSTQCSLIHLAREIVISLNKEQECAPFCTTYPLPLDKTLFKESALTLTSRQNLTL